MAYTNAWTDNVPLGSEAAGNIDDFMRRARLDIHERMNDVVVDWTADPVVPKSLAGGQIIIPAAGFQGWQDTTQWFEATDWQMGDTYPLPTPSGSRNIVCPISGYVAVGRKITKLEWLIDRNTAPSFTASLLSATFDLALTPATEHTISTAVGGLQILDSGAIAITIVNTKIYMLTADIGIAGGHNARLYAVRVTLG